jgi:molecular chaperone HtpG
MATTYNSRVNKKLLELLMFQMYGDSELIYREYVQNARDAINDAVKADILSSITEGRISITIDRNNQRIVIEDNGTGVSINNVEPVLLDIAAGNKDGETSAGQFGIGRLVGGYFCKKLSFKTSYQGEEYASEIVFDIDKIKQILYDESDSSEATVVIDTATEKNIYEEQKDKHYFIVTLEDVSLEYDNLLSEDKIIEYLQEVAPVNYGDAFNVNLICTNIKNEYIELQKQVGHFQITVNETHIIKKRYGLEIEGTKDKILSLEYFPLRDDSGNLLAWGWYAVTPFTKAIPIDDRNSCFRLRKHNIQVGDANFLTQYFPKQETRGNKYFYGEIHIANQRIKLNSARDGLAPTPEAISFKASVRTFFDYLVKLYHLGNTTKKETERALDEINNAAPADLPEVAKKWETEFKKIESTKNAQSAAAQQMIKSYKEQINEALKILPEKTTKTTGTTPPIIVTPPPAPQDMLEPLKTKYSTDKLDLIRKIFDIFSRSCRTQDQKSIKELIKIAIRDLGK